MIFISDFMQFDIDAYNAHIRELTAMLGNIFPNAISFLRDLNEPTDEETIFSVDKFLAKSGLTVEKIAHGHINGGRIFSYKGLDVSKISQESILYFSSFFKKKSLLIGYEIGNLSLFLLEKAQLDYIDLWLHPARFCRDINFIVRTNNKKIANKLSALNIKDIDLKNEANYISMRYKILNNKKYSEDYSIFVGQSYTDRSILKDGKLLSILDFQDQFIEFCNHNNIVYYAPHPHASYPDLQKNKISNFISSISNAIMIENQTIYSFLSDSNMRSLITISSSVAYEAKFFNKKSYYLYYPIVDLSNKMVFSIKARCLLLEEFWNFLLSQSIKSNRKNIATIQSYCTPNFPMNTIFCSYQKPIGYHADYIKRSFKDD